MFDLTVICVLLGLIDGHVCDDHFVAGASDVAGVQLQLQGVQAAQVLQQEHGLLRVALVQTELTRFRVINLEGK